MINIDWDSQPLGQEYDTIIAERLGVSHDTVYYQRRKRGIAACGTRGLRHGIDWDRVPLGSVTDLVIAGRLQVHRATVQRARQTRGIAPYEKPKQPTGRFRPDIDWDRVPLGDMCDSHLAKRLGVGVSTVHTERRRRGIPKHNPATGRDAILMAAGLGVLPDAEVAESTGVNIYMVARMRRQRRLSAPRRRGEP